jgi:hypothetical protein
MRTILLLASAATAATGALIGLTYWFWHWSETTQDYEHDRSRKYGYFMPAGFALAGLVGWLWFQVIRHDEFDPIGGAVGFAFLYGGVGTWTVYLWRKARLQRLHQEARATEEFVRMVQSENDE